MRTRLGAGLVALLVTFTLPVRTQTPGVSVTARARALQPGELVILTVTSPVSITEMRVSAFGRDLHPFAIDPRTWRVFVGIDLDVAAGSHRVSISAGTPPHTVSTTYILKVLAKRFRTRTLKVDEAFVNPPASAAERIRAEAEELGRISNPPIAPPPLAPLAPPAPFIRPVPHPSTSAFGTRSIFNGQPRSAHSGADFLSPAGTPVVAPGDGRIALAKDLYYSGGTVVIDHGAGVFSLFAHLSKTDVTPESRITRGDVVGRVGATGRVTGPHLHWTVRVGGARIDPLSLLALVGALAGR